MEYGAVLGRISADLENIWGEMTPYIMKKRFNDVGGSIDNPSKDQIEKVIVLIEEKALIIALGKEMARKKTLQYMRWLKEACPNEIG